MRGSDLAQFMFIGRLKLLQPLRHLSGCFCLGRVDPDINPDMAAESSAYVEKRHGQIRASIAASIIRYKKIDNFIN